MSRVRHPDAAPSFPPSQLLEATVATSAPAMRGSFRWYLNRMVVMQPMELPHRVATAAASVVGMATRKLGLRNLPKTRLIPVKPWLNGAERLPRIEPAAYLREADAIAAGRIRRLDGQFVSLGRPCDWLSATGDAADGLQEDIRHGMELHRHAHWVRLAQAWRLGQDPRHLQVLLEQLDSWLSQCAAPQGVAWASSLDAGIRLLNWSMVWQLLDAQRSEVVDDALRQRWLASIYVHARFVRKNRSRHSSANNHLIGELLGLIVAGATWPFWRDVVAWGRDAANEITIQALRQTHSDGVGREQASWYQGFVFELLAVFVHIEHTQGRSVDKRLLRRMSAMVNFIVAITDAGGHLSHHGDADHAGVVTLGFETDAVCQRMLALAIELRLVPELAVLLTGPSPTTAWVFPGRADAALLQRQQGAEVCAGVPVKTAPRNTKTVARRRVPRAFTEGGYFLLGRNFGALDEVLITFDAGPLGYLGIAAHGHADALSVRLSVAGQPLLVDRGTYVYNTEPRWRQYLRGTLAHNTVCIDAADQSEYGGPFLWLRKASCTVDSFSSQDAAGHVDAWHDGYRRLAEPVVHRRRIDWLGSQDRIVVRDSLQGAGSHEAVVAWHFAPGCAATLDGESALVQVGGTRLRLSTSDPGDNGHWELHIACPDRPLGWHSARFGRLEAACTLLWRTRISGPTELVTHLDLKLA